MKIRILFIALLLLGNIFTQAQPPTVSSQEIKETPIATPADEDCVELIDFTNTCDENGNVELSFFIFNNTDNIVTAFNVQTAQGLTLVSVGNIILDPFTTYPEPIVIVLEDDPSLYPEEGFCWYITLYDEDLEECCTKEFCTDIGVCDCGFIENETIVCSLENQDEYDYCFTVTNPAYATGTVNQIVFFPSIDNVCINGNPPPYPVIISPPLEPGNSTNVCVTVEACEGTLPSGTDIDFVVFLEDFMTDYCCHLATSITTPSCCDDLIAEVVPKPSNCDVADGSVTITPFGGTPPYTITGFGQVIDGVTGTTLIENLATGIYDYTITDAIGCEIAGTIEIGEIPCECNNINDSLQSDGVGLEQFQYTSNGDGFICISFNTVAQPDALQVSVDGVLVANSGLYSTDLTQSEAEAAYPNCIGIVGGAQTSGVPQPYTVSIPISIGQVIDLSVFGSTCPGNDETFWSLNIFCQASPCNVLPSPGDQQSNEEPVKTTKDEHKRLAASNASINLYPNPTSDWLNIKMDNKIEGVATLKILNVTGSVLANHSKNIQPNSNIKLNVEELVNGIYFLEFQHANGEVETQKFVIKR